MEASCSIATILTGRKKRNFVRECSCDPWQVRKERHRMDADKRDELDRSNLIACIWLLCLCNGYCFTCAHNPRAIYMRNNFMREVTRSLVIYNMFIRDKLRASLNFLYLLPRVKISAK